MPRQRRTLGTEGTVTVNGDTLVFKSFNGNGQIFLFVNEWAELRDWIDATLPKLTPEEAAKLVADPNWPQPVEEK